MSDGSLAAAGSTTSTERVRAALIADAVSVSPGQPFTVALRLDITDGWHTYWRNPGDSGEPTRIDWALPDGVEAGDIQWPAPQRIPYGPLVNFGYEGQVLHLVEVTVPESWPPDRPLTLNASASWLVCKDICIPENADLRLTLAAAGESGGSTSIAGAAIAAARDRLPRPYAGDARFSMAPPIDAAAAGALVLSLSPPGLPADATSAYFFPDAWGAVDPIAPQRLERVGEDLFLSMSPGDRAPEDRLAGVVVFSPELAQADPRRLALEIVASRDDAVAAPGVAGGAGSGSTGVDGGGGATTTTAQGLSPGVLVALGMALVGGLLLNVMPCVFPVLSMKAMSVISHGADRRALRVSGLSYTAGILVFVGLVAALLIGLKTAGVAVGWGFQLQAPAFVAAMALVIFTLGLSLSGVFTIGATVMGWGGGIGAGRADGLGSFLTGALAALVATPCTAPFMGVALGFALTQPWPIATAVFLALGFGLALPYLALTMAPNLAKWLPRPGAWMDRVKQLLAFPLYLTAAWLVWVLSLQAGAGAVFAVLVGMILVAFAAWLFESRLSLDGIRRRLVGAAALACALAAFALATWPPAGAVPLAPGGAIAGGAIAGGAGDVGAEAAPVRGGPDFEPFSPTRLADLRAAGSPIFVNVTAAWCITCQVNDRLALSSQRVGDAFRARGIVALKGDWTNRDPDITRLLESFGRSGVPLYLFYPAGQEEPVILPQLLTESTVIDAIASQPLIAKGDLLRKGSG